VTIVEFRALLQQLAAAWASLDGDLDHA